MMLYHPRSVECRQCGAPAGERCRPLTLFLGVHLVRLLDWGGKPKVR